jgi:hypothetical protein
MSGDANRTQPESHGKPPETMKPVAGFWRNSTILKPLLNLVRQKTEWPVCLLVLLLTACAFLPVLANDFVEWDDAINIYQNPYILGLDTRRLHWMFTDVGYSMRYKPLTWLGYALIYALNGLTLLVSIWRGCCFIA